MEIKWTYLQFRKTHDYPVYLRFRQEELNPKFQHLLGELGFSELPEKDARRISLQRPHTRILTVQYASLRLQQQINGSDMLDQYGPESLSYIGGMPVYTYRRVALLGMPTGKPLWDLALSPELTSTEHLVGLRVVLVRFLAAALADQGVLCYWGTVKDGTVVIMKQAQSFGEAVVIDHGQHCVHFNGGEIRTGNRLRLIRKDKEVRQPAPMGREDLISFLSVSSCLLTFTGITPAMRKAIFELSAATQASYLSSEAPAAA
jgi:hypothetical protein